MQAEDRGVLDVVETVVPAAAIAENKRFWRQALRTFLALQEDIMEWLFYAGVLLLFVVVAHVV